MVLKLTYLNNMKNRFDKVKHEYYSDDVKLDNVTSWLGKYTGEYKPYLIANARANGKGNTQGLSVEDMMNVGDLRNSIAINYGNAVHETIELWIKYKYRPTQKHLEICLDKFIEKYGEDYESEKRIYNVEYMLGGTADLIALTDDYLDDIKTNETEKKSYTKMLPPLEKYRADNKNKAALQLSVYEFLLGEKKTKRVLNWNGEYWKTIELPDIDVSEIMESKRKEVEQAKLIENMF